MLDKNYEHLLTSSMAQLGVHDVSKFKGQATPEIFPITLNEHDIDKPLLDALIQRWHRRYWKSRQTWEDIALFRSINMAKAACELPAIVDATMYDVGRSLAMWVSAFEILAHPGVGKSNFSAVCSLLDKASLHDRQLRQRRFVLKGRTSKRRSLIVWLYELYKARNDFLHGNPVSSKRLRPTGWRVPLLDLAPPMYRLALTGFLDLTFKMSAPAVDDVRAYADYVCRRQDHFHFQNLIERGLLRARKAQLS